VNAWSQFRAILLLPGVVLGVIPATILYFTGIHWLPFPWSVVLPIVGCVLVNAIYIPLVEEPGLERRFGDDYFLYKKNVPRWIPRLRPWEGLSEDK